MLVRFLQVDLPQHLLQHPPDDLAFWAAFWADILSRDSLNRLFVKAVDAISGSPVNRPDDFPARARPLVDYVNQAAMMFSSREDAVRYLYSKEAYIARYLHGLLPQPGQDPAAVDFPRKLNDLLLKVVPAPDLGQVLKLADPLYLAKGQGREAVLSPIGILHLFQQYFFEFATFLGPPVEHVWLSPGATTELIEISTRRVLEEHTFERFAESILRSEISTTSQDELSQAFRDENQKNTKLGSSLSGGVNFLIAHIEASGTASIEETQKRAREETHRTVRQQSAKLSSEIRSNYRSTFRTVTEMTDTRSKRYVIQNPTPQLVNYELRRKMRLVGVQMQDIGTYACWQVYVDDPGAELGVSQLVHLASKADLSKYAHQPLKAVPDPKGDTTIFALLLPVPNRGERSKLGPIVASGFLGAVATGAAVPGAAIGVAVYEVLDDLFGDNKERQSWYTTNPPNTINQQYQISLPDGYQVADASGQDDDDVFKKGAGDVPMHWPGINGARLKFHLSVLSRTTGTLNLVIHDGDVTPGEVIEFKAKIRIVPTTAKKDDVEEENKKIIEENKNKDIERERRIKEEFVKSVKDRVKLASGIKTRPAEDLREEERTVVYRRLIERLMREAWTLSVDRKLAHLRSELVKSIFDVDRMLYFVAPEWWQPRLHRSSLRSGAQMPDGSPRAELALNDNSRKALNAAAGLKSALNSHRAKASLGALGTEDLVGWGGEGRQDNYLITEDSAPARLGSSLGWLLQLDGDNLRNSFLNAPWVKAVIPVRPGREREALAWLKQSQVEGIEGLSEIYAGDDAAAFKAKYTQKYGVAKSPTIEETLELLADDIAAKHERALQVAAEEIEVTPGQTQTVHYLPPDEVFEKGFDPLQGGFRATLDPDPKKKHFQRFDQWLEVLPTDQIVAVEVRYDPKTGFQL
jgi:hypothetical protein